MSKNPPKGMLFFHFLLKDLYYINSPGYKYRLRAFILSLGMIRIRINSESRKLINKRYKASIKAQISRDPADWSVYERLRNVTKELRMAEANYWSASKLNDSRSGSKEFWNVVKLLTGKSAKSKPVGPIMCEQKELVVEDSTTAAPLTFSFQQLGKNLPNLSHRGRLTLILLFIELPLQWVI